MPQYGPPWSEGWRRDLFSNVRAAGRAWVFRRPVPGSWRPFSNQILSLLALDAAIPLLLALVESAGQGTFQWSALPRAAFPLPLALLAGWLISQRARTDRALPLVATVALALLLVLDLAGAALDLLQRLEWLPSDDEALVEPGFLLFAWWAAVTGVAVARLLATTWPARVADALWCLAALALPLWWVPYAPLWGPADEDAADAYAVAREEVVYAQPRLLRETALRLAPQRPGVEDVYFVGAAGYADENVFLNEASLAAEVVRTRFDADGRIALLSNDARTIRTLPLASATSLRQTLQAVARTMNTEEDTLFLFVTTHGSEDHTLAMEFWPLQLAGITPDMLRSMLDEAGFKWRVVVLSACYAGGFVEALRNSRTLVMTAADAFNQSFGCGADSDLTYFGKAFFDEALRETVSLPAAFDRARAAIAAREARQRFAPSNPVMFVGEDMRPRLDRLARRMELRLGGRSSRSRCEPSAAAGTGCEDSRVGAN